MNWNPDRTTVEKAVFLERLREVLSREEWILDGNYGSTIELRLQACDTAFFPGLSCGGFAWTASGNGVERSGRICPGSREQEEDADFLAFIRAYPIQSRPKVLELLARYSEKETHIFRDRRSGCVSGNALRFWRWRTHVFCLWRNGTCLSAEKGTNGFAKSLIGSAILTGRWTRTSFSSVVHHIIGQQISTKAQATIWNRCRMRWGHQRRNDSVSRGPKTAKPGHDLPEGGVYHGFCRKGPLRGLRYGAVEQMPDAEAIQALSSLKGIGVDGRNDFIVLFAAAGRISATTTLPFSGLADGLSPSGNRPGAV